MKSLSKGINCCSLGKINNYSVVILSMAATRAAFAELIGQDVRVELHRLRKLSFYGIPSEVRGEVWKRLLLALPSSEEVLESVSAYGDSTRSRGGASTLLSREDGHNVDDGNDDKHELLSDGRMMVVVKSELGRFRGGVHDFFRKTKSAERVHSLLGSYLQSGDVSVGDGRNFERDEAQLLVRLAAPLAYVFKKQSVAAMCFTSFMRGLEGRFALRNRKRILANFMMLFRSRLPDLHTHFEEEVESSEWAKSWLNGLLCRELPFHDLLRLWDTYFSVPDGFELHTCVCVAILEHFKEDLEDLDRSELIAFLDRLPPMDIDQIVTRSQHIALDFNVKNGVSSSSSATRSAAVAWSSEV